MTSPPFDETEFARRYERLKPGLLITAGNLAGIVGDVVAATDQQRLARAKVIDESRVKGPDSIKRKAGPRGWTASNAVDSCEDVVGVRVVCNNVSDVQRFVDLLLRRLGEEKGGPLGMDGPLDVAVEDHTAAPTSDGYRAVHVKFRLPTSGGGPFYYATVGCEVQIRTLLQDGWARLSHKDAYKTEDLPEDLTARFRDLSSVLEAADRIAQDIRDRIAVVRAAPDERPALDSVTDDGIAYLFASTFGKNPPEYAMRVVRQEFAQQSVTSLNEFELLLKDGKLRRRIERAYEKGFRDRGRLSPEDTFLFLAVAVGRGEKKAIKEASLRGKSEWDYIDAAWRSEVKAELPNSANQFLEELEGDELPVHSLAELFGAHSKCAICNADIVDPDAFEDGASSHYDDHDFDGRVSGYLMGSGIETGGFENSSLCSYHDNMMSKDD